MLFSLDPDISKFLEKHINSEQNAVYQLSAAGVAMIPILLELFDWGEHLMRLPNGNHFLENEVIALRE